FRRDPLLAAAEEHEGRGDAAASPMAEHRDLVILRARRHQRRRERYQADIRLRWFQRGEIFLAKTGVRLARDEGGRFETVDEKITIGGDAKHDRVLECSDKPTPRLLTCRAVSDDLRQHRVVIGRNDNTRHKGMIDSNARAGW